MTSYGTEELGHHSSGNGLSPFGAKPLPEAMLNYCQQRMWNPSENNQMFFQKIITVTSSWPRWRLKSPAYRLFAPPFAQAQIIESIKTPRHWPLWGKSTGDRWIPLTKVPAAQKRFPFDDVIMCIRNYRMKISTHVHRPQCVKLENIMIH